MRLRKPCEHDVYDAHEVTALQRELARTYSNPFCSGGEFLPEDALVIEKVNGQWSVADVDRMARAIHEANNEGALHPDRWEDELSLQQDTDRHFAALSLTNFAKLAADQVGESG